MKNLIMIAFLMIATCLLSCNQNAKELEENKVPDKVLSAFEKAYPEAKDVEWEKEGDYFEVEFEKDGIETEIVFDKTGMVISTDSDNEDDEDEDDSHDHDEDHDHDSH